MIVASEYSAVIPTLNRPEAVGRCVRALLAQERPPCEILIVDASPVEAQERVGDVVRQMARAQDAIVRLIGAPRGLTRQRNVGVAHAGADWVLFLDDDIEVAPDFAARLLPVLEKEGAIGGMGAIESRRELGWRRYMLSRVRRLFRMAHDFGDGRFMESGLAGYPLGRKDFRETEVLSGGLTFWQRHICEEVRFDERLEGYGVLEDADFSWRAHYRGKLLYVPEARVLHRHESVGGRPDEYGLGRMYGKHYRYLFEKNFGAHPRGRRWGFRLACTGYQIMAVGLGKGRWAAGFRVGLREGLELARSMRAD